MFKFWNRLKNVALNNIKKMALAANDVNAKINDGWEKIKKNAINKLEHYLTTGEAQYLFSKKEWMDYYT